MRRTTCAIVSIAVGALSITWSAPVHGAVLCVRRSKISVRTACTKKETQLDLAQFGAVGPKGDAGPAGSIAGAPAGGDLSGTYPAPTIAAAPTPTPVAANPRTTTDPCVDPTPQTGVYCGTSLVFWRSYDPFGIEFWRDRVGEIHVRGAAETFGGGAVGAVPIFRLPVGARPVKILAFPIVISLGATGGAGGAMLYVYPDGRLTVDNEDDSVTSPDRVFLGEIRFRPDA